tara:strand:- start:2762 stop:3289 length:528 start_codon:yes stop_codon:yes gene_type:complete
MEILYALQRLDVRLFLALFRGGERRLIRPLARALSRSADGYLYLLLPLLLWTTGTDHVAELILLLMCALLAERGTYWLLKNGLKRPRPQEAMPDFHSIIVAADRFSFPSGHTSAAFLLATSLTLVYQEPAMAMYAWAAAVALSRVILGVHYPGDTLAGAVMGSTIAILTATELGI